MRDTLKLNKGMINVMWNILIAAIVLALLPYIVGGVVSVVIVFFAAIEAVKSMRADRKEYENRDKH